MRSTSWLPLLSSSMAVMITASPAPAAAKFNCEKLPVDGYTYNFKELSGPHTVVTSEFLAPSYHNTTYTIDLCGGLKSKTGGERERCPEGTRVCAIKHKWDPKTDKATVDHFVPIVVEKKDGGFEWEAKRLPAEEAKGKGDEDKKKEGLRVTLKGGKYLGRQQQTVVEFKCSGLKGDEEEWDSKKLVEYERVNKRRRAEDEGDDGFSTPEHQLRKEGAALVWEGYKSDGEVDTLALTWYTKFVCDKAVGDEPEKGKEPEEGGGESAHWGFFTWFVVLVFLGIATYLIFGSWLNYNRYGARGWDLLPHGDTLRDVPYLLKDWMRRALNTIQSSGSRGGYSAV
uniref:Autophagy-related protein 27 n=1 Tax=Podospora anserina (strain S / ATCC MYA-4624 / DSM 980 / FGSC 10383) TaxID=515849 RepID=A0A090CPM0_PODAN|nr:Putative Autophagy protein Atg27 [Podospora anserina S mat+]